VAARMRAIHPVIEQKVAAGKLGTPPLIPSGARALRNIAEHADFGKGEDALPSTVLDAKRRQRRGKKWRAKRDGTGGADSADAEESCGCHSLETLVQEVSALKSKVQESEHAAVVAAAQLDDLSTRLEGARSQLSRYEKEHIEAEMSHQKIQRELVEQVELLKGELDFSAKRLDEAAEVARRDGEILSCVVASTGVLLKPSAATGPLRAIIGDVGESYNIVIRGIERYLDRNNLVWWLDELELFGSAKPVPRSRARRRG